MAMTRPKSSQVEHRGETVQKVIDDITQEDGVLNADPSWADVPKLKGANANKQAQALANRDEYVLSRVARGVLSFETRDDFIAAVANGYTSHLENGALVNAGGVFYEVSSESTSIPLLPGFAPFGGPDARHFGASTIAADNNAAIMAAINAFGSVAIMEEYRTSRLLINKAGARIHGRGLLFSNNGDVIWAHANGITIEGISVESGYRPGGSGTGNYCIVQDGAYDGLTVRGVTARHASISPIRVLFGTNATIEKCTVSDSNTYGISCHYTTNATVSGNLVERTRLEGIRVFGDVTRKARSSRVTGNTVRNTVEGMGIRVAYYALNVHGVEDVVVTGNTVHNCGHTGITIQAVNAVCSDNISRNNGTLKSHQGILVSGDNITIANNVIDTVTGVGIDVGEGTKVVITGNQVIKSGIIGIEINSVDSFLISGNVVFQSYNTSDGDIQAGTRAGIIIWGNNMFPAPTTWGIVKDNMISAGASIYQDIGIYLATSIGYKVIVEGNQILNPGITGKAYVFNCQDTKFECYKNLTNDVVTFADGVLTIPNSGDYFLIRPSILTQGQPITSIATYAGRDFQGRQIKLLFDTAQLVVDGENLRLQGNLNGTSRTVLSLVCEGGLYHEISRSIGV